MQSLASLIQADFRLPSNDYTDLLKVTRALTRNHADVMRAFRQMAFNVAAHARDDHTKNFAFLIDANDEWALTPAYDLAFAPGPGGEHTMTVAGEGRSPQREHCLAVGEAAGVRKREAEAAIEAVNEAVQRWKEFADEAACPRAMANRVGRSLRPL
jgi:serine/threonine-protein kinase HipA